MENSKQTNLIILSPHIEDTKGGVATFVKNLKANFNFQLYITQSEKGILSYKIFQVFNLLFFTIKLSISWKIKIVYAQASEINSIFRKLAYLVISKCMLKRCMMHIHAAKLDNSFKEKLAVRIIKFFNIKIIVLSEHWKTIFSDLGCNDALVVPNPVLNDDLFDIPVEDNYSPKLKILFLGRVGKRKGIDILIKSLKNLNKKFSQDVEVIVAGDGEVEKYENLCKELGYMNINFIGWADDSKRLELMKWANVLCLPSRHEGMPLSIIEGLASAKIVIASDIPPIKHGFKSPPQGLILFENENPNDLCESFEFLINLDTHHAINLMKLNRKYAKEHLSYTKFLKSIDSLLKK